MRWRRRSALSRSRATRAMTPSCWRSRKCSLPNFGYWKVRLSLLAGGRMPRTRTLDYSWWATPNIHLCTLADFVDLANECSATIVEAYALDEQGTTHKVAPGSLSHGWLGPNLFAQGGVFLLKKKLSRK